MLVKNCVFNLFLSFHTANVTNHCEIVRNLSTWGQASTEPISWKHSVRIIVLNDATYRLKNGSTKIKDNRINIIVVQLSITFKYVKIVTIKIYKVKTINKTFRVKKIKCVGDYFYI